MRASIDAPEPRGTRRARCRWGLSRTLRTMSEPPIPALPDDLSSDAALRAFLGGLPPLEPGALETRAAALARPTGADASREDLELAISCTDLTSLEPTDTPSTVAALCARALEPDTDDPTAPSVAAVCVHSDLVDAAARELAGTGVEVAGVAGAFPHGRAPLAVRTAEASAVVAAGAGDVDVVIDRGALLEGRVAEVVAGITALRDAVGDATLKVIVEESDLGDPAIVRDAAWLALLAGADFVKTSTGKGAHGATLAGTLVLADAVAALEVATGRQAGVKPAGGIRDAATALEHVDAVRGALGASEVHRGRFRLGASTLLDDLLGRRRGLVG